MSDQITSTKTSEKTEQELLADLVWLCRRAGERFDLVQAGGGNASYRSADETLWVKGSGLALSAVTVESGLSKLDNAALLTLLSNLEPQAHDVPLAELERLSNAGTADAHEAGVRPSIETLAHSVLGPFTLHTHPVAVMALMCRSDWKELAASILPDAYLVPYTTPGVKLAFLLKQIVVDSQVGSKRQGTGEAGVRVALLQNHGVFVAARDAKTCFAVTESIVNTICDKLGMHMPNYALCSRLSESIREQCGTDVCTTLCEDDWLKHTLKTQAELVWAPSAVPDHAVYCGLESVRMRDLSDVQALSRFGEKYRRFPNVVEVGEELFFVSQSVRKCKEIEEVLKAHAMALKQIPEELRTYLQESELHHLVNWEAEKFRQNLR